MDKLKAGDPDTKSADIVAENITALKALFPDAVTDGQIDFDVLKQLLGGTVNEREEKYGLNWHGKRQARKNALSPSTGTLLPRLVDSICWDTTRNLMIDGDNLEALKLLAKSYAGKINVIYIDPPYNTGNDFVYSDDFRDNLHNYFLITGQINETGQVKGSNPETSGRFHTKWLNMMLPRLKLAKNFLTSDGVILISIDNKELSNLRILCNEVFGEENFISCFVWEKGRKNDAKLVSNGHEYILCYANSLSKLRELGVIWREEKPGAREIWDKYAELRNVHGRDNDAIEADLQDWYSSLPKSHPSKKWSRYRRVDEHGPWRDRDISWPGGGGPRYDVIHPTSGQPCKVPERGWVYSSQEEMKRQIRLGLIVFREDHTEPPFRKAHIRPITDESTDEDSEYPIENFEEKKSDEEEFATQVRGSYFYKQSQVSIREMRKLMGEKIFDNPKDCEEISRIIQYVSAGNKEAVVMDFFAGSGTTGHAIYLLNSTDGGRRRFILVQLPEKLDPTRNNQKLAANFCDSIGKPRTISELTRERLRRAGDSFKKTKIAGQLDFGFRVYELSTSNIRAWDARTSDLKSTLLESVNHVESDRTELDVVTELLLKLGLDLCVPIEQRNIGTATVYSIGKGALFVCLLDNIKHNMVEGISMGIVTWHRELTPAISTRVVFKDSGFIDDVAKSNMAAILNQNGITDLRSL